MTGSVGAVQHSAAAEQRRAERISALTARRSVVTLTDAAACLALHCAHFALAASGSPTPPAPPLSPRRNPKLLCHRRSKTSGRHLRTSSLRHEGEAARRCNAHHLPCPHRNSRCCSRSQCSSSLKQQRRAIARHLCRPCTPRSSAPPLRCLSTLVYPLHSRPPALDSPPPPSCLVPRRCLLPRCST